MIHPSVAVGARANLNYFSDPLEIGRYLAIGCGANLDKIAVDLPVCRVQHRGRELPAATE